MEKVSSTGRETYNSQIGECVAKYTKTTTASNVVISVEVTRGDESVYTASYDKLLNRYSGGMKRFDAVSAEERVAIVAQVMEDVNSIL